MASPTEDERLRRWRLVLGKESQRSRSGTAIDQGLAISLMGDDEQMDKVLEALYDSDRSAGLGSSCPNVNRWLGDIRTYFPKSVVQVMQKDALERLKLQKMLLEPETLETMEADIHLVGTLLVAQQRDSQENARDGTQGGAQGRRRPRAPAAQPDDRGRSRRSFQGHAARHVREPARSTGTERSARTCTTINPTAARSSPIGWWATAASDRRCATSCFASIRVARWRRRSSIRASSARCWPRFAP